MNIRNGETPGDRAASDGHFDDLPLAGKPLNLGPNSDPDWWLKGLMKREKISASDLAPPAVLLCREAKTFTENLRRFRTVAHLIEAAEDLNKRILADRLRPATTSLVIYAPTVDVDEAVAQWRSERTPPPESAATVDPPKAKRPWWKWWDD